VRAFAAGAPACGAGAPCEWTLAVTYRVNVATNAANRIPDCVVIRIYSIIAPGVQPNVCLNAAMYALTLE
jgi:hypothetical protein